MKYFTSDKAELNFYRQVFSQMNASVYILNLDPYKIEWVAPNSLLSRVLGIDQHTILEMGDTIYGRVLEKPDFRESIVDALKQFDIDPDSNWGGVYRIKNFREETKWLVYTSKTFLKNAEGKATKAVCVAIDANDIFCTPKTLEHFKEYINSGIYKQVYEGLTTRQLSVLRGLVQGDSIKAISESIGISYHTVVDHKKALFKKLDCRNTLELVQAARDKGLVKPLIPL